MMSYYDLLQIQTITSVLKLWTDIITSITAHPMSVSAFKTDIIIYVF